MHQTLCLDTALEEIHKREAELQVQEHMIEEE